MAEIFYRNIVKVAVAASACFPYGRGSLALLWLRRRFWWG